MKKAIIVLLLLFSISYLLMAQKKRPEKFSPDMWLEVGKNPGLGIKKLHEKGIVGDGISIAVIDKCINPNHKEFLGRVIYRQISAPLAKDSQYRLHFHGIACASILCGKNCGIAPEAKLFYFAVPDDGRNLVNYCIAMEEIIKTNINLPEDLKIKLVSISDGIGGGDAEDYESHQKGFDKAQKSLPHNTRKPMPLNIMRNSLTSGRILILEYLITRLEDCLDQKLS